MKEYLETIHIVFIPTENVHGTVSKLGAFASEVSYSIDNVEYYEVMDNNDFIVLDEINIMHFEEKISHEELEENE